MTGILDWIGPVLGLALAAAHELVLIITGKDRLL